MQDPLVDTASFIREGTLEELLAVPRVRVEGEGEGEGEGERGGITGGGESRR